MHPQEDMLPVVELPRNIWRLIGVHLAMILAVAMMMVLLPVKGI